LLNTKAFASSSDGSAQKEEKVCRKGEVEQIESGRRLEM
jgi:hypothetical protein